MIEIDKIVSIAVKWWADQIDGTTDKIAYQDACEKLQEYKDIDPENITDPSVITDILKYIKAIDAYKGKEDIFVMQEQRRRFEFQLEKYIRRDLTERKVAYLYTEDDARAGGILGVATYYASIRNEGDKEDEPSPFPKSIEMYVTENAIEIRYDGNSPLYKIYETEPEKF